MPTGWSASRLLRSIVGTLFAASLAGACLVGGPISQKVVGDEPGGGQQVIVIPPPDFQRLANSKANMAPRVAAGPLGAGTFQQHSRPSATKVIYLDFDGHVTSNTPWSNSDITTVAFDIDSNPGTFNAQEQATIVEIWQRVSECFSPFDVDVTTEPPTIPNLVNSGGGDTKWGIRVLFGTSTPSPAPGAGGVAFIGGFGWNFNGGAVDIPCFVLQQGMGTGAKVNADACIHEVGHTLGLNHDGLFPANDANHLGYYQGHGTGKVAWAPNMGVGYYVPLVQWSKGEYANADNFQDDLAVITTQNGFGYRTDDFSSTQSGAKSIPGTPASNSLSVNVSGVIETTGDSDWFKILCGTGAIKLDAVGGPANTMLDIQLSLYDSNGVLVVAANPADDLIASINQNVNGGTYYAKIEGVGLGNPLTTGYTRYSSLGQYTITGSFSTKGLKGAPVLTNASSLFYGIKDQPKPINTVVVVTDPDSTTQASATVAITSNFVAAEDVLSLTVNPATMGNITASYDKTKGILTLDSANATATVDEFKAALRAVCYSNTNSTPKLSPRTITFSTFDGLIGSNGLNNTVTIGNYYVTASYNAGAKTLTVSDSLTDNADNSVAISLRSGKVVVEGGGATRIGTSASNQQSVSFPFSNDVIIICNFNGGNDTISLVSLKSSSTTLNLGPGNDTASLTYCTIGGLSVNGGPGTDVVKLVGTTVTNPTLYIAVP